MATDLPAANPPTTDPSSLDPEAVRAVVAELADALCDNAAMFTCDEAEQVAVLLGWAGLSEEAVWFLANHAVDGDTDAAARHRTPAAVLDALDRLGIPPTTGRDRAELVAEAFS